MTPKDILLDEEELQILHDFENGEFESIDNLVTEKRMLEETARNTLQTYKQVNIKLLSRDLEVIRKMAVKEGIPYQTLISSIVHKYLNGLLLPQVS